MMCTRILLAAAASVLALGFAAAPVIAQQTPYQQQTQPPTATGDAKPAVDRESARFVKNAATTDMFEIEAAKIALQNSRNEAVRSFAQRMIDDHERLSGHVKAAGKQHAGAGEAAQLERKHKVKLDELRRETGANFDRKYMEMQVQGHREALRLHQNYAKQGDDAALKKAASEAVPQIEQHLQQAQGLEKQTANVPPDRGPGQQPRR
jgi:putative membrane protein